MSADGFSAPERFWMEWQKPAGDYSLPDLSEAVAELCRRATVRTRPDIDDFEQWLDHLDYAEKGRDEDGGLILDTTTLTEPDFRAMVMGMLDANLGALRAFDAHIKRHCEIMDAWRQRDEQWMRLLSQLRRGEIDERAIERFMADNVAKWEEHRDG